VDVPTALALLGLDGSASWEEIRTAHRVAIRASHPDAGGDAAAAARVNEAYQLLRRAGLPGSVAPPPSSSGQPASARSEPAPDETQRVRGDDVGDVVSRLADAAHSIGELVFVDPQAGLLEVIVGRAPGVGQLVAHVTAPTELGGDVPVAFTLDPLGVAPAPSIREVVRDLLAQLPRRSGD